MAATAALGIGKLFAAFGTGLATGLFVQVKVGKGAPPGPAAPALGPAPGGAPALPQGTPPAAPPPAGTKGIDDVGAAPTAAERGTWRDATNPDLTPPIVARYKKLLHEEPGTQVVEEHGGRVWRLRVVTKVSDPDFTKHEKDVRGWIWVCPKPEKAEADADAAPVEDDASGLDDSPIVQRIRSAYERAFSAPPTTQAECARLGCPACADATTAGYGNEPPGVGCCGYNAEPGTLSGVSLEDGERLGLGAFAVPFRLVDHGGVPIRIVQSGGIPVRAADASAAAALPAGAPPGAQPASSPPALPPPAPPGAKATPAPAASPAPTTTKGIGDDLVRNVLAPAAGVTASILAPGTPAGKAAYEGVLAIKRKADKDTGHKDPNDPGTKGASPMSATMQPEGVGARRHTLQSTMPTPQQFGYTKSGRGWVPPNQTQRIKFEAAVAQWKRDNGAAGRGIRRRRVRSNATLRKVLRALSDCRSQGYSFSSDVTSSFPASFDWSQVSDDSFDASSLFMGSDDDLTADDPGDGGGAGDDDMSGLVTFEELDAMGAAARDDSPAALGATREQQIREERKLGHEIQEEHRVIAHEAHLVKRLERELEHCRAEHEKRGGADPELEAEIHELAHERNALIGAIHSAMRFFGRNNVRLLQEIHAGLGSVGTIQTHLAEERRHLAHGRHKEGHERRLVEHLEHELLECRHAHQRHPSAELEHEAHLLEHEIRELAEAIEHATRLLEHRAVEMRADMRHRRHYDGLGRAEGSYHPLFEAEGAAPADDLGRTRPPAPRASRAPSGRAPSRGRGGYAPIYGAPGRGYRPRFGGGYGGGTSSSTTTIIEEGSPDDDMSGAGGCCRPSKSGPQRYERRFGDGLSN